jgi:hypothetical protein
MTSNDILHWIGALSLLAYGLASAIRPQWVAGILENGLLSGRGVSEFRVAHGGGMIGMALFALFVNHPLVFHLMGWGWLGAAIVRVLAYLPDRPKVDASYLAFLAMEIGFGVFLLL